MSDKRATYAIGAVAATLALVIGLITAVPVSSDIAINSSPLNMMGHAVVVLKDTDGSIIAYQQTDNIVVLNGADCAADLLFGTVTAELCDGTASEFTKIRIGSSTDTAVDTETHLVDDLDFTGTGVLIDGSAAISGGTGATKTIRGAFVLTGTSTTVGEVGLFDGTGEFDDMFSRFVLGVPITAGALDTVTITYVITVGSFT